MAQPVAAMNQLQMAPQQRFAATDYWGDPRMGGSPYTPNPTLHPTSGVSGFYRSPTPGQYQPGLPGPQGGQGTLGTTTTVDPGLSTTGPPGGPVGPPHDFPGQMEGDPSTEGPDPLHPGYQPSDSDWPNYGFPWQGDPNILYPTEPYVSPYSLAQFGGPYSQMGATPDFSLMAGANNALLMGGPGAGAMDALGGTMTGNLTSMFGGPSVAPYAGISGANDPTQAISNMLSGQGNYGLVQQAVAAGAQPTIDRLFEDVLPQLRSRGIAAANPTGEIKDINRIVPRVMRDISNIGTQAALGEYNRALGAQGTAAQLMAPLGQRSSEFGASLQQNAMDTYRQQVLGLGGLGTDLLGQQSGDIRAGLAMMPQTIQTGMMPAQQMQQFGNFQAGFEQSALQDAINRWNFEENRPIEMMNWYNQLIQGVPGLGGTQTSSVATNPMAGAAGGAMAGAGLGSMAGATSLMGVAGASPPLWPFLLAGGLAGGLGTS